MKVQPGLSGFGDDPESASGSIAELVVFAKRRVPKKDWRNTKVQLMADAELEGLGLEVTDKILESCRHVLRSSGFLFEDEWARVIQGRIFMLFLFLVWS